MANLGKVLAWGIENSLPGEEGNKQTELTQKDLADLFMNQKSDATLMIESMDAISSPDEAWKNADGTHMSASEILENKKTAFDNFEQLVEQLDNAMNIENLKLWPALLAQLKSDHRDLRELALWCCGTAVQNNEKTQKDLFNHGGIEAITEMMLKDEDAAVRKKACYAFSSAVRNFQEGLDKGMALLPEEYQIKGLSAEDMPGVDRLMEQLRGRAAKVISQ
ncbi:armadillo-type protein [Pyronema domesticum]|uniref:Similar to Hsp70 nucleotide exchange factor fes1 acc. no. Q0CH70 n=1 Tax=Pyronema omphalodes (strain CBS 100304) TaxID=1076935 RepID=U4L0D9_PYROM|nr:armadillo-type protein [Pyronema domesticum]CCX07673.1 Similar to Hsp70 nucleotide exchange factor fes1; acc. no. Q0CH70 [Pyronema omphalodes CBS 100304]